MSVPDTAATGMGCWRGDGVAAGVGWRGDVRRHSGRRRDGLLVGRRSGWGVLLLIVNLLPGLMRGRSSSRGVLLFLPLVPSTTSPLTLARVVVLSAPLLHAHFQPLHVAPAPTVEEMQQLPPGRRVRRSQRGATAAAWMKSEGSHRSCYRRGGLAGGRSCCPDGMG